MSCSLRFPIRRFVLLVVLSLVGSANAGQFNFFFTSPDDPNTSTAELALQHRSNPSVPAGGMREITLWVAVDPSVVPSGEGLTGAWLSIGQTGNQTYASDLVPYNPNNRWTLQSVPGTAASGDYTHEWLQLGTLGTWVGPQGAAPDALIDGLWIYRLATGSFNANNPGGLFIEIPFFGAVGYSDVSNWDPAYPNLNSGSGGASFGFAGGQFDTTAIARNYYDPSQVVSVPYRNGDPAQGFLADTVYYEGAIRTTTPDVIVVPASNPEPATLVLLALGSAVVSRRRR